MLEVRWLTKHFSGLRALQDASFDVAEGSVVGLIGPNGAGKSTLVNCITGLLAPTAGTARWRARVISGCSPEQVVRAGVSRTFQQPRLFPERTVLENVMVGAHPLGASGFLSAVFRLPRVRRDERILEGAAMDALGAVGCDELAHQEAASLTAGQSRLVGVARALAARPALLLLDEPAAGLNDRETETLSQNLRELVRTRDLTVLVIEHHLSFVMGLSDRVVVLSFGEVIASGTPEQIQSNPAVIDAYIGVG